jgi:hypothetical protein
MSDGASRNELPAAASWWPRLWWTAVLGAVFACAATGVVDRPAGAYTESALTRAMVTFGVARTLNGVLSVVQETEVALQPAGVGIALMPGQLLDPINDLVERFSWIMLASGVSLGMQSTLMRISAWWPIDALVGLSVLLLLWMLWRPHDGEPGTVRLLVQRVTMIVLYLRFVVPVLLLVTSLLSSLFLQEEQVASTQKLLDTADKVSALAQDVEQQAQPMDRSLMERLGNYVGDQLTQFDVSQRIERAREVLAESVQYMVALIASFLLETVVIPLVLLWVFWQLLRWTFVPLSRS